MVKLKPIHPDIDSFFSEDQSSITEFTTMERVIKQGLQPNSPDLLTRYLQMGEDCAKLKPEVQFQIYQYILLTLFETISATNIASHWRLICLNYCYRPLFALQRASQTKLQKKDTQKFRKRLASLREF